MMKVFAQWVPHNLTDMKLISIVPYDSESILFKHDVPPATVKKLV